MKKILTACAVFACAHSVQAYELVARVSAWDETQCHIEIELAKNDIGFTAFQMDITLDGDAKLKRDSITCGSLLKDHRLIFNKQSGYYRMLCYNLENRTLCGKEGQLFSFTVVGDVEGISFGGITFVKKDGYGVEPDLCADDDNGNKEHSAVYDMTGSQAFRIDQRGISIRRGK